MNEIGLIQDDFIKFDSEKELDITVENNAELFMIKTLTNIDYPLFKDKY